jgi:type IV pilus assembly protein PilP
MRSLSTVALLVGAALLAGCGEEEIVQGKDIPVDRKPEATEDKATEAESDLPPKSEFSEAEFAESDRSRDPFRSYAEAFLEESKGKVKSQREVVLDQYAIDELKLIGIITRIHPAKAMLVDPNGVGHVVRRGQFVGRPEIVQTAAGTGASYEINWRIDRIRDGDIVLVREDPSNPDVPSATRVIALRTENTLIEAE